MSERFGKIESDLTVGAGNSIRRNAGDTAFEEFTPAGTSDSQTLTNKTIDADDNTISNIETDNFKSGVIDTDETLSADSDTKIPTQQAVKGYVDDGVLSYIQTGWTPTGDTLTYASATTFTVSGDQTDRYSKGAKIKLTNSTVKYFYVVSSSYSSPNTTVTVTGESDLASGSITSPYFSYNDAPQGFKDGRSYYNFIAKQTSSQTINNATYTKVQFNVEEDDPNGNYDSTTNYRYTAPVSGLYALDTHLWVYDSDGKLRESRCALYKNGSRLFKRTLLFSSDISFMPIGISTNIRLNKGDYIEIYIYVTTSDSGSVSPSIGSADQARFSMNFIGV